MSWNCIRVREVVISVTKRSVHLTRLVCHARCAVGDGACARPSGRLFGDCLASRRLGRWLFAQMSRRPVLCVPPTIRGAGRPRNTSESTSMGKCRLSCNRSVLPRSHWVICITRPEWYIDGLLCDTFVCHWGVTFSLYSKQDSHGPVGISVIFSSCVSVCVSVTSHRPPG